MLKNQKNKTTIIAEPNKQEIFVIREFDASRELVFKAFTDSKLYAQWLGRNGVKTIIEKFEPISGGNWRYIQRDEKGNEAAFHGVNHEVLAPERIISTFEFEGFHEGGHVLLQTAKFEALPNERTKCVIQLLLQSVADRDGMLQANMEEGMLETYERLDELLIKLQK